MILKKCKDIQERQFYIIATKKFGWTSENLPESYQTLLPSTQQITENYLIFLMMQSFKRQKAATWRTNLLLFIFSINPTPPPPHYHQNLGL